MHDDQEPVGQEAGQPAESRNIGQTVAPQRQLTPAARRALAEAAERRRSTEAAAKDAAKEINGRGGLDPARYGDWEVKGIISDF